MSETDTHTKDQLKKRKKKKGDQKRRHTKYREEEVNNKAGESKRGNKGAKTSQF